MAAVGWVLVAGGLIFSAASMLVEGGLANYTFVDNPVELVAADAAVVKLVRTLAMLGLGLVVIASLAKIEVHLVDGDEALPFSVEDDGRGVDPATVERGAGLQNMTDRLQALGGDLRIDSSPGRGTAWLATSHIG
jgi:glucose-6-phosphate-specific signal transduction histidine kinase